MGIDFAAEGLLDGLEGDDRATRLELLEQLSADGISLDELRAATRDGRLLFVGAERMISGIPRYSTRQVSERAGVSPEFVMALRRANGLPVPDIDAVVCSEADIDGALLARRFLEAGVSEEQQLAVVRVLGRGLAQAAEVMRATVLELALEPGASEAQLARRIAAQVEGFMPLIGPMLEQMARLHLRHMVRTEAISAAERADGMLPGAREVTVAFADLVGFTRLGEEVDAGELGRVAQRLVGLTVEHLRGQVRLVKTIGDAAMLVSPDAPTLLEVALDLVDAADAEGEDFPQLRIGVASGAALSRAGDWYGRPVNIASRITTIARPGSVLATRAVRDASGNGYRWSSAGARSLKGVDEPVRLYRVRRARGEDAEAA
ncbi:MAG TPA: adenylate cyclase regulatory domain-containing protein [Solirubrobacteraceae bacterium]|nr:adenylate cyclase regulatory domain-containing protein [Solirubrobacteraceae bacterium]